MMRKMFNTPWIRFLNWFASHLLFRGIHRENGVLYLGRYRLHGWMPTDQKDRRFNAYLHWIHLEDADDATHNHPWDWAFSIVLSGWYREERLQKSYHVNEISGFDCEAIITLRTVRFFNFIRHDTFHKITKLSPQPVWTLFITGRKTKSWGFYELGRGFVPWRTRLTERGIPLPY